MEVFHIRLYLVRHGQTDANLNKIVQGQHDTPLNSTGKEQAKKAAAILKNANAHFVVSSDLKRALETARIISKHLNIPLKVDKKLREMRLGAWEGKSFKEVEMEESASVWRNTPSKWKIEGSETLEQVQRRMLDVVRKYADEDVILVSHGIAIATVLLYFKGLPLDFIWEYLPENASVTELDVDFADDERMIRREV